MSSAVTRPALRYHGGKYRIASWIIAHFPAHEVYVEPFGGAASVLMAKPRSPVEIYNDLDDRVVNVFRVLRDSESAAELARQLTLTPWARAEFRLSFEPAGDPIEQARRTIVRAMMGFGTSGLVRRRTGFRATTYRNRLQDYSKDWASYPAAIHAFTERLRGVRIESEPAARLLSRHNDARVLWYVDPPYPHSTRSKVGIDGHNGYRHEMTDADHRALAEVLRAAKGSVVLSGYPCDLYDRELYADWHRVERAALADGACKRVEVLWLNARAAAGMQTTLFAGVA